MFTQKIIITVLKKLDINSHICPLVSISGQLPVDDLRGKPLCMELYPLLFSSCRIPGPKHDYVAHYGRSRRSPTHITVVRNYQVGQAGDRWRCRVHISLPLVVLRHSVMLVLVQSHLFFFFYFVVCLFSEHLNQLETCSTLRTAVTWPHKKIFWQQVIVWDQKFWQREESKQTWSECFQPLVTFTLKLQNIWLFSFN